MSVCRVGDNVVKVQWGCIRNVCVALHLSHAIHNSSLGVICSRLKGEFSKGACIILADKVDGRSIDTNTKTIPREVDKIWAHLSI